MFKWELNSSDVENSIKLQDSLKKIQPDPPTQLLEKKIKEKKMFPSLFSEQRPNDLITYSFVYSLFIDVYISITQL